MGESFEWLCSLFFFRLLFFFFQADDGIRGGHVTGVQTCALPICPAGCRCPRRCPRHRRGCRACRSPGRPARRSRSEERRVGKEGWCGGSEGDIDKDEDVWWVRLSMLVK